VRGVNPECLRRPHNAAKLFKCECIFAFAQLVSLSYLALLYGVRSNAICMRIARCLSVSLLTPLQGNLIRQQTWPELFQWNGNPFVKNIEQFRRTLPVWRTDDRHT